MSFEIENGVLKKYIPEKCETEVVIPDGVTIIDFNVFQDCENIVSVVLPDGLKEINDEVFSRCKNLRSINFPDSLTYIGYASFYDCESLVSIDIPKSVECIGDETFGNCKNLTTLRINNPEVKLFCDFLYGCEKLTDIYVQGLNAYDRILSCVEDTEDVNIYVDGELSDHSDDWNWNVQNDWDGILDFYRNNREKWLAEINNRK